jgi:PAS domain S-box-containing protein
MTPKRSLQKAAALKQRIEVLEATIVEQDHVLDAIQRGEVDALVVTENPEQYHLLALQGGEQPYRIFQSVEHPYRVFIEQIQEGAVTLGEDGTMLYGNLRFADMLGVPEAQVIGQKLQPFLMPADVAAFDRMLDEAKLASVRGELTLCPAGGTTITVRLSLSFLRKDKDATLLCGVMTDVSEHKRALEELAKANTRLERLANDLQRAQEQAERANQAKSRFLTGITHELRTPLHGILGYAELLALEGNLNPIQSERLEAMMAAGEYLLGTINSVLDMSRIEADQLELHPAWIELTELVRACLDVVRPTADGKGLALVLASAAPIRLFADPTRLRQVLVNLLGNAVKFTPAGSVEVRLLPVDGGQSIRVEVVDTGPGIWARHRDKLFQTFERLNAEAMSGIEGAGLGLALSARLVQAMGGRIGYDDNPAGGSIFWAQLPCGTADLVESPADLGTSPQDVPRMRVLIVDDEALNRNIARGFLTLAGHQVVCVGSGAAAIQAAAAEDFDVILMDVRMPGMNGLEATRLIRALPVPRGQVRVVAVTAQAFSQHIELCRQAGMDCHVSKPFKQAVLLAALANTRTAPGNTVLAETLPPTALLTAVPEIATLDRGMFEDVAQSLTAAELAENLEILATRLETLRRDLLTPGKLSAPGPLTEAAHKLAGGAGTFGFLAVAATARRFEAAADTHMETAQLRVLADHLVADIGASLAVLRQDFIAMTTTSP